MNTQALTILSSLISLLGICYLFFWRYRALELAWFRQDLFDLRDELFDCAESGKISFSHPAYGVLRSCINGYIRYGGRMTLWHVLIVHLFTIGIKKPSVTFDEVWEDAQKGLHPEIISEIDQLKNRMEGIAFRHCLLSAPEATLIVLPPVVLTFFIVSIIQAHPASTLWQKLRTLDDTAYLFGEGLTAT